MKTIYKLVFAISALFAISSINALGLVDAALSIPGAVVGSVLGDGYGYYGGGYGYPGYYNGYAPYYNWGYYPSSYYYY